MTTLSDRLDGFPEPWKPTKPGSKLLGELVDRDTRASEYGEPYVILTIEAEEGSTVDGRPIAGEWAWHAFHTMSRSEVTRRDPQIGDRVGVAYHGLGEAREGMNAPARFRLVVERTKPALEDAAEAGLDASDFVRGGEGAVDDGTAGGGAVDDDIPF